MHHPPEVSELLDALLAGAKRALGDNLLGFYLRGSLALGDFDPETSDIDTLVVTQRPVSDAQFDALAALHDRIAAGNNPYSDHFEVSYIDRASIKRFAPGERRHPMMSSHNEPPFGRHEHGENWALERWTVREHGVALLGPDPKTLIDPISPEELLRAARARLPGWARWAAHPDNPEWLPRRSHQAYVVETMCRALHTLALGEVSTKPQAVAWALETLAEPWRSLVRRSQAWRADDADDASTVPEVLRFVRWAASQAEAG